MRALPVGVVDLDHSAESRELVQTLSSFPRLTSSTSNRRAAAQRAMAASDIYALMVIPDDWATKAAGSRTDSALELYFNQSFYAIAVTIESDLKTALPADSDGRSSRPRCADRRGPRRQPRAASDGD